MCRDSWKVPLNLMETRKVRQVVINTIKKARNSGEQRFLNLNFVRKS